MLVNITDSFAQSPYKSAVYGMAKSGISIVTVKVVDFKTVINADFLNFNNTTQRTYTT